MAPTRTHSNIGSSPPSSFSSITSGTDDSNPMDESRMATLTLNPTEKNARRRYIRVGVALPWNPPESFLAESVKQTKDAITSGFVKTLRTWPFLSGRVRILRRFPEELTVEYDKVCAVEEQPDLRHLLVFDEEALEWRGDDRFEVDEQVADGHFDFTFFVEGNEYDLADGGVPPVTLQTNFVGHGIILGFSFYEALFDGESITCFIKRFAETTHENRPTNDRAIISSDTRNQDWLQGDNKPGKSIVQSGDLRSDLRAFPFYDWRGLCNPQPPLHHDELCTKIVNISSATATRAIASIRNLMHDEKIHGIVRNQDCVAGLFWVTIMRARYNNGRFPRNGTARVCIPFPGGPHFRWPRIQDTTYFGNSTVTVMAQCEAKHLTHCAPRSDGELSEVAMTFEYMNAARHLRQAQTDVDMEYLRKLVNIKKETDAEDDWAAYDRAVRTGWDCLTLQDWTGYSEAAVTGIPYTDQEQARVFPGEDMAEEGMVVLMPRDRGNRGRGSWPVWLCLREEDMRETLTQLDVEGLLAPRGLEPGGALGL